jgi:hypothetical protein
LYSVSYESPAGARGAATKIDFGNHYESARHALNMAYGIYEVIVSFAKILDYRKTFEKRVRAVPSGFVLEIFLKKFSPYRGEVGELYGYIKCEETDERRPESATI